MSTQQPAGAVQTITSGDLTDAVLGADNKTVLVGTAEGWVTAFDIATGNVVNRWKVGTKLGGMDVSPDGRYLVATEQTAPPGTGGTGQAYHTTVTVHVLDMTTGAVRDYSTEVYGSEYVFSDASYLTDGTILLSGSVYSSWVPLTVLDPTTGTFTRGKEDPFNAFPGSTFVTTADGTVVINQDDYKVSTYSVRDGLKLVKDNSPHANGNGAGYAVSPNGDMLLAGSTLYKDGLKTSLDLYAIQPEAWSPNGWAFSPDGQHAYMLVVRTGRVLQMSTKDWSIERVLPIGFEVSDYPGWYGKAYGDRLTVTPDGKYLVVLDDKVLSTINLQTVVALEGSDKSEQIVGGAGKDSLYGYGGNDTLDGGAGDDDLHGGAGDDVLIGSAGTDYLDGGAGNDTVDYSNATVAIDVRLSQGYGRHNPSGLADTLSGIDNVKGGAFDDYIEGDWGANRLEGGGGADVIWGSAGDDILRGGDGDDRLSGGEGADVLDGGSGLDIASYGDSSVGLTIDLSTQTGIGGDTLISIEGLEGSSYADSLTGDAQANVLSGVNGDDKLFGVDGDDVLWGGSGDDALDGGAGVDTARYSSFSWNYKVTTDGGVTTVQDLRTGYPGQYDGKDTLVSVEKIVFGPVASDYAFRTELSYLLRYKSYEQALSSDQKAVLTQWSLGGINADQMVGKLVVMAGSTTSVATLSYQFFTGKIPGEAGVDYLVSPTGYNPNNLNSAYYQSFNLENRYINFAVNLGKLGEGKEAFLAKYGSLSFVDATREAYKTIFGAAPTDAKIHAMIDTRIDYFAAYGGDGVNGIGTKAAMVGWLLAEAQKADLGVMVRSNDAWLTDLADGSAPFAIDILDPAKGYYKADFIFGGS